jgi:hypothetical protein
VDAGGLGGDEQLLADLPVGPALGDQGEHLSLPPGEIKRGRWEDGDSGAATGDRLFQAQTRSR